MGHGKSLLMPQWLKIYYNIFFATGSLTAKQLERLPCSPNLTIFEALPTISMLRGSWASKLAECHSFLPSLETNAGRKTALSGQMELCWSLLAGLCWSVSWECIDHDGQETDCGRRWKHLLEGINCLAQSFCVAAVKDAPEGSTEGHLLLSSHAHLEGAPVQGGKNMVICWKVANKLKIH